MREYFRGFDIVSRPDPPSGLMRLLFHCSAGVSFITYKAVKGTKRNLGYVDPMISTVLCFMFIHDADNKVDFDVYEISRELEISVEDVARALMFMYIHGLVCEVQYCDGAITYALSDTGCSLAWEIFCLEDRTKCAWKVGIAEDDRSLRLIPILLCPNPPVLFE